MLLALLMQMPVLAPESEFALPETPPACGAPFSPEPPIPPASRQFDARPPFGDELGDAWEMEETSCWRGIWTRRDQEGRWDAYWIHPRGERATAELSISNRGRDVLVTRRHLNGSSCRYQGTISYDWWEIRGTYTCSWEPGTVLNWRAQIIRLERSEPLLLRQAPGAVEPPPTATFGRD